MEGAVTISTLFKIYQTIAAIAVAIDTRGSHLSLNCSNFKMTAVSAR